MQQGVWQNDREYLEQCYVGFLRVHYPDLDEFKAFVTNRFEEAGHVVKDEMRDWPRDIRICVVRHLSFRDAMALFQTCQHWRAVTHSRSYNDFWKHVYLRDYLAHPITHALPKSDFTVFKLVRDAESNKKKRLKVNVRVLWFDAYHYIHSRKTQKKFRFNAFHTFLEAKHGVQFKKQRALIPIIKAGVYDSLERFKFYTTRRGFQMPIDFFPQGLVERINVGNDTFMSSYTFKYKMHDAIADHPHHFFHRDVHLTGTGIWLSRFQFTNISYTFQGQPLQNLFLPGPLKDLLEKTS